MKSGRDAKGAKGNGNGTGERLHDAAIGSGLRRVGVRGPASLLRARKERPFALTHGKEELFAKAPGPYKPSWVALQLRVRKYGRESGKQ